MLKANAVKKLAICSLVSTVAMGSSAMAHTTIQSTITADSSGVTSTNYNNIVIGHTCSLTTGTGNTAVTKEFPIQAQSVLFPTVEPLVYVDYVDSSSTKSDLTLEDLIGPAPTSRVPDPVSLGLAGIPQLIQSKDIFEKQSEKTDAEGNVIGFNSFKGNLDSSLHGLVPFRFNAIAFKTGVTGLTNSCVKKLLVKVAIADVCKTSFGKGGPKEGQANLWIPNTTTKFANVVDGTSATALAGSPATLTIDNSSACANGSTVTVFPSNADIDNNLIIPKVWGK